MFAKKTIEQLVKKHETQNVNTLKRSLGPIHLVALGIGAIVGAGIFSLTGIVASENAGPAVILSFILAAVACAFCALCYAEYASMIPVAGSAYTYTYATLGEFMAWIIGWDLVLEYALASATVAVSWSSYATKLLAQFHINLPPELTASPYDTIKLADGSLLHGGIINLPAVVIVALLSLVLAKGTKESSGLNITCYYKIKCNSTVYSIRLVVYKTIALHSISTRKYRRIWALRLVGSCTWCGGCIFRFYRFRCCIYSGTRSQKSSKRCAHWYYWVFSRSYNTLCCFCIRNDGACTLYRF